MQSDYKFKPKHLKLWETPRNYMGGDLFGWYSVIGVHRDSGMIDQSNFDAVLSELQGLEPWPEVEGEDGNMVDAVAIHEFGHWAVGWTKSIYVHESYELGVLLADDLMEHLENYAILDEDDYFEREYADYCEFVEEYWASAFRDFCEDLEDLVEDSEIFRQEVLYQDDAWVAGLAISCGDMHLSLSDFYEHGEVQSNDIWGDRVMLEMFTQMFTLWMKNEAERKADGWEQLPLIQGE